MKLQERFAWGCSGGTVFSAGLAASWLRHGWQDGYSSAIHVMLTVAAIGVLGFAILAVVWWRSCLQSSLARDSMYSAFSCWLRAVFCGLAFYAMLHSTFWVNFEHPHTLHLLFTGMVFTVALLNVLGIIKHARLAFYFERARRHNSNAELNDLLEKARRA